MTPSRVEVERAAARQGLAALGWTRLEPGAPILAAEAGAHDLALIGPGGPGFWDVFAASAEARDGAADPLDRWSRRIGDALAAELGATALFPFDGPPYAPFYAWMLASGRAFASPIGLMVHVERGLWISLRFALALPSAGDPIHDAAPSQTGPSQTAPGQTAPCETCAGQPCRVACPVDAFAGGFYDAEACAAHLRGAAGRDCLQLGCRARRACPVGRDAAPPPEQNVFHMAAFLSARTGGG